MKRTSWSQGLSVTADGRGVVPLARSVAVRLLADRVGLTDGLSAALTRRGFVPGHDRGQVWVDVATMLTGGGEAIADIDTLRHQEGLLGPVASAPTVWRTLDEATPVALARVERARAKVRRHVWGLLPQLPASPVAGADLGEVVVLDVDATLVTAHSEKERARATFKGGFGFHPIGVWCDNIAELLAISLRPGNAGSNHAGDHIDVLTRALAQVPTAYRRRLLVRADGAGATHELLDWLTEKGQVRGRRLGYSVGFPTKNTALTSAITTIPEPVWTPGGHLRRRDPRRRRSRRGHRTARSAPLAGWDAGHCPPGTAAPRRAAVAAGGGRRLALPSLRHQHPGRAAGVLGSPAPGPRPGRGPDQGRQRHRPRPVPITGVRHQPGLAADSCRGCRSDRLAAAARTRR